MLVYLSEILYAINVLLPILSHVARNVLLKFELDTAYICQNGLKKLHCKIIIFSGWKLFYILHIFYVCHGISRNFVHHSH